MYIQVIFLLILKTKPDSLVIYGMYFKDITAIV